MNLVDEKVSLFKNKENTAKVTWMQIQAKARSLTLTQFEDLLAQRHEEVKHYKERMKGEERNKEKGKGRRETKTKRQDKKTEREGKIQKKKTQTE